MPILVQLVLNENMKIAKPVTISKDTTFDELVIIASKKLNCKIKTITDENKICYDPLILSNNIKLLCSPHILDVKPIEEFKKKNEPYIKVYADETFVSDDAIKQLHILAAKFDDITHLIGMPDLHVGKYPIGCVVITNKNIYPEFVGEDIGCGMSLTKLGIKVDKFNKLNTLSKNLYLDGNSTKEEADKYQILNNSDEILARLLDDHKLQIGTVGRGNHFVEMQIIDKIHDIDLANALELDDNKYYLMVHSGSRGLGESILNKYINKEISLAQYIAFHDCAIEWAKQNRLAIADKFNNFVDTDMKCILDITHNYVEIKKHNDDTIYIHRKGAAPAYNPVIIPGSRGDFTYLVMPTNATIESGFSLAHGAGRKMSRHDAYSKGINKDSNIDIKNIDNIVICENKNLFFEEAPFAYKDINVVINDLVKFGLVKVIASFKPVITYKCRE